MSDATLAIIFRNPRPKRSPIDNELHLLRRDGSSSHIHYSNKGELNRAEASASDHSRVTTKEDGSFVFPHVAAGATYQATVTAEGLSQWSSSVTVEPGQEETLNDMKLRILTVPRAKTVNYSAKEVAAQQLNSEEQQRAF
jgi:hypothetical protein